MLKKFIELDLYSALIIGGIESISIDMEESKDYKFEHQGTYLVNVNKIISLRHYKNYIEIHTSTYILGRYKYMYEVFSSEEEARQRYNYLFDVVIGE